MGHLWVTSSGTSIYLFIPSACIGSLELILDHPRYRDEGLGPASSDVTDFLDST